MGLRRVVVIVIVAVFAASCGAPTFTTRKQAAASHRLPRTEPSALPTKIGDAVTLDRTDTTPPTTADAGVVAPGVSMRAVDGLQLVMQTNETATFRQGTAVHLVLTLTNNTGRSVGYLTNRESHFALVDAANRVVWSDQTCRSPDVYNTVPTGYLELAPGDHVSVDDYYPTHPGTDGTNCRAPAGHASLTGGLTVCLNLNADWTCRGASDERVEATPIAVNVS